MPRFSSHLVVEIPADDAQSLLREWGWLVGNGKSVLLVTASGDLFFAEPDGPVLWLETGSGRLTEVAPSVQAFDAALEDEANWREWLLAPVIERLRSSGKILGPGQCYGFRIPPVVGGAYDGENRVAIAATEHFGFTGHLHGKLKDLPDGTQIKLEWE